MEQNLTKMRKLADEHTQAVAQIAEINNSIGDKDALLAQMLLKITAAPNSMEYSTLARVIQEASNDYSRCEQEVRTFNVGVQNLAVAVAERQGIIHTHADKKRTLEKQRDDSLAEVKLLAFNNALIKRVREVRPLVANQLWNKVLTAVSFYFTKMRGTPSTVVKSAGGFKVDGQSIACLSGSTLDALGFAVRLALTKTFAPHVAMLIVDEPFAAMDGERTANSLGFLSSCGFSQIILVTHEELSTANADHIVTI